MVASQPQLSEPGAETQARFRYQNAYGIVLLLERQQLHGKPPYVAVRCEQIDDFYCEVSTDEWHAFQLKTRLDEKGAWQLNDEPVQAAIRHFGAIRKRWPQLKEFYFVSNVRALDTQARGEIHLSPIQLCDACRNTATPGRLSEPLKRALGTLAEKTGLPNKSLHALLRQTWFREGPPLRDFRGAIVDRLLRNHAGVRDLTPDLLFQLFEDLVARFTEAAASRVGDRDHTSPPNRLDESVIAECVARVRQRIETRSGLLSRYGRGRRGTDGILDFLHHYTKIADTPVPFGGRERQLAELDAWLADAEAPRYLLLTAPAASGKSALLVQWVCALQARGVNVVFYPVSYRFNTNAAGDVFSRLCAAIAGRDIATEASDGREEFSRALREIDPARPVLVVIDGLDEALDWRPEPGLFPLNPSSGLRVVVSARLLLGDSSPRAWQDRLGWRHPRLARVIDGLPPLTLEQINELTSRTLPGLTLADRTEFPRQLHRLSDGDPLLVRLYLDECLSLPDGTSLMAWLKPLESGYGALFDRALGEELKEGCTTREFLTVVSVAPGPIFKRDLDKLGVNVPAQDAIDARLARLVIGDGKSRGFAFSHPKLRDFYAEHRLQPKDQRHWNERILRYGFDHLDDLEQRRISVDQASPFLVRHFGAQLERMSAPAAQIARLTTPVWADTWYALEAAYTGFLDDVARATRSGAHPEDRWNVVGFRHALIEARVKRAGQSLHRAVMAGLIDEGMWSPDFALQYAREHPLPAYGAVLATRLPEERVTEAFEFFLNVRPNSADAELLRSIIAFFPRVTEAQRRTAMQRLVARMHGEDAALERFAAAAELLPHLDETKRAEVIGWLRRQTGDGAARYPEAYETLLPALRPAEREPFAFAAFGWTALGKMHADGELTPEAAASGHIQALGFAEFWRQYPFLPRYLRPVLRRQIYDGFLATPRKDYSNRLETLIAAFNGTTADEPARAALVAEIDRLNTTAAGLTEHIVASIAILPDVAPARADEIRADLRRLVQQEENPDRLLPSLSQIAQAFDLGAAEDIALRALARLEATPHWHSIWDSDELIKFIPPPHRRRALKLCIQSHRRLSPEAFAEVALWTLAADFPDDGRQLDEVYGRLERLFVTVRTDVCRGIAEIEPVPAADRILPMFVDRVEKMSPEQLRRAFAAASPGARRAFLARFFRINDPGSGPLGVDHWIYFSDDGDELVRVVAAMGTRLPVDAADIILTSLERYPKGGRTYGGSVRQALIALIPVMPTSLLDHAAAVALKLEPTDAVKVRAAIGERVDRVPATFNWQQAFPNDWNDPLAASEFLAGVRATSSRLSASQATALLEKVREAAPVWVMPPVLAAVHDRLEAPVRSEFLQRAIEVFSPEITNWMDVKNAMLLIEALPETRSGKIPASLLARLHDIAPEDLQEILGKLGPILGPEWIDRLLPRATVSTWQSRELAIAALPHFSAGARLNVTQYWLQEYLAGRLLTLAGWTNGLAELGESDFRQFWRRWLKHAAPKGWTFLLKEFAHLTKTLARHVDLDTRRAMFETIGEIADWWRTSDGGPTS